MRKSPTFDPASPALVAAIAILAAPRWLGTASDLAALLPLHIRPSRPALLAIQIREAVGPLAALGVTLSMRREPKTGRRMITLARGDDGVVDAVCVPHVVSASYAPARARLERRPSIQWHTDGAVPAPGACCAACGNSRWWWRSGCCFWACEACHPTPAAEPMMLRWVNT